ncbi:hypothetical protein evm_014167 [Chilo suppressalis]|nr:hypothetical protein evm_014167 [Chilo suppressalis]
MSITSHGLYGLVEIENCKYLIYITEINKKKNFEGNQVFEIRNVGVLNLSGSCNHKKEIKDLINFFEMPGIYYSSYPLYKENSIGKSNGDDFIFNFAPLKEMLGLNPELKQFGVKCIQGFYGVENVKGIDLYLICRRSCRRIGTRFFSRGSSSDGYVSNYVESELFFYTNNKKMSYLQVRGSIPLYWSHEVMLNYTPKLIIHKKNNFEKCDEVIRDKYQDILYLNLINNKNYEKPINDKFNGVLKENNCEVVNFDLNSAGSFQNKRTVIDFNSKIKNYLDKFDFKTPEDQQKGVIRTNCIDCLDRTNLTQFKISEEIIKKMCDYSEIPSFNEILKSNRSLWLNNGNYLSLQYSGTGALKSYIVEAQIEGKLMLDVFGDRIEFECDTYSVKNNTLVYTYEDSLIYYDLIGKSILSKHHIFSKPIKLQQSENGKISGVLNTDNVLFVFNLENQIFMENNVSKFELSHNILAYVSGDKMILKSHNEPQPFHRSSDIYSNFYSFDDFCILATRKSLEDNNYKIYKISPEKSIVIGSFDIMEQFSCKINKEKTHILMRLATSYVKNSYFAHTEVHIFDIANTKLEKMPKLSNISDFNFLKNGFVIIFGSQPSNVCVYDYNKNQIKRFPKGLRNQAYFNPHYNIVALAGFGQLSGDIEIYNTETMEKYGELCELGANNIQWENNGTYFYVSTTSYLKEDNKITMYDYCGRKIKEEKYKALISSIVYGLEEPFIELEKPSASVKTRKEVYVPPHLAGKGPTRKTFIKENKNNTNKIEPKKKPQEILENLKNLLKEIENLQKKLKDGESLSTKEMNLILKEDSIRNKIEKFKQ